MAKCPNCDEKIAWDSSECARCKAIYSRTSSWQPIPETSDEEQKLKQRYGGLSAIPGTIDVEKLPLETQRHYSQIGILGRIGYLSLIFWVPLFVASLMGFDAPGSEKRIWSWIFLGSVVTLPIAVIAAPPLARRAVLRDRIKLAYILVVTPQALLYAPIGLSVLWMAFWYFRFAL